MSPLALGLGVFLVLSAAAQYWRDRTMLPSALSPGESRRGRWPRKNLPLIAVAVTAGLAALAVRTYLVRAYRVTGGSMLPTLAADDLVAAIPAQYGSRRLPARGDVVVFRTDAAASRGLQLPEVLVKRVVGLPGDRIAMSGGVPIINGWVVPTCDVGEYLHVGSYSGEPPLHGRLRLEFLADRAYLTVQAVGAPFAETYEVGPGEVFVLGDDRGNSVDSRSFNAGDGGGVGLGSLEARVSAFLVGTGRFGGSDYGRLLQSVDALQTDLHLPGIETASLLEGIDACLRHRPTGTSPPEKPVLRNPEPRF